MSEKQKSIIVVFGQIVVSINMQTRITYFDKLKGLTIIFVVIGHVLTHSLKIHSLTIELLVVSWYMPLFFFISGYFYLHSLSRITSFTDLLKTIGKRMLQLLVPFFVVGWVESVVRNHSIMSVPDLRFGWFLPTLFYCILFYSVLFYVFKTLNITNWLVRLIVFGVIFGGLAALYKFVNPSIPYYLHFLKSIPFFSFGILYSRHEKLQNFMFHDVVFAIALVCFVGCLAVQKYMGVNFSFSAFFAIVCLVKLFKTYDENIPVLLSKIGKVTLPIYVFHGLFLPYFPHWASVLLPSDCSETFLSNPDFLLPFLVAVLISVPVIFLSMLLHRVIDSNKYLKMLFYGQLR